MNSGKRVPLRTCIGCRQSRDKHELIRVVRVDDQTARVDLTGRMNGRGAYICPDSACLMKAFRSKGLERALKVPVTEEVKDALSREIENIEHA